MAGRARRPVSQERSSTAGSFHERIARSGLAGRAARDVAGELGWSVAEAEAEAARQEAHGALIRAAGRLIGRESWDRAAAAVRSELGRLHAEDPLRSGFLREPLRKSTAGDMTKEAFRELLETLVAEGSIRLAGDRVAAAAHRVELSPADEARSEALESAFLRAGLDPPDAATASRAHGGERGARLLELLVEQGRLVRIVDGRLFHVSALADVRRKVRAFARTSSTMDVAAFKDLAGVTRKNAIPLLEQLDAERLTRRVGNVREILERETTA